MIVKCTKCEAIEWAYNLLATPDYDTCPICGGQEFKTITGLEGHYTQSELWDLWDCLGEVPVNDKDETEQSFLFFPAGTDRMEIWHWFDEKYDGGVYKLMEDVEG